MTGTIPITIRKCSAGCSIIWQVHPLFPIPRFFISHNLREDDVVAASNINRENEYTQICADIKATDEISFKLLGFVPLVSGAGILTLFLKNQVVSSPELFLISIFSALITLGIFRWELRNIQICNWLRWRSDQLVGVKRPAPPGRWGKTEAECLIYSATTVSWVALPWICLPRPNGSPPTWMLMVAGVQVLVFVFLIVSIVSRPHRSQ